MKQSGDTLLPEQRSIYYDYLREDTSPLAKETLAAIDAIHLGSVRPSLTAYLDLLPYLFLALCFFTAMLISLLEFIGKLSVTTSLYLFPGTVLLKLVESMRLHIHFLPAPDKQICLKYSWLAISIILVLFTLRWSLKVLLSSLKAYLNALTGKYSINKGCLRITQDIFIRRTTTNIDLLRIQDVVFCKSFINRITGDGTLLLVFGQGESMRNISVKGLTRGKTLEDTYARLLNLVSISRTLPPEKGIIELVETVGSNLLVVAATLASIIQGLDVIERRWKEHQEKRLQGALKPQTSIQQSVSPSPKPDKEIIEIFLVMDDGSHYSFRRWMSDSNALRTFIDAFSDPTSKVKPLQVIFRKRDASKFMVDVTTGGKDNRQLDVILSYLESE